MAYEWIAAETALRFLTDAAFPYLYQQAICERAHSGMIAAKADLLIWAGEEHRNRIVPKEFWWAEGHEALEQNWEAGDFRTWIDQKVEVKAFGVSFDFNGILELASPEARAEGMRRISVLGDPQWLTAKELHRLVYERNAISCAGPIIIEACTMGHLSARAVRASGIERTYGTMGTERSWGAREWDVPVWFWRDYTKTERSSLDWSTGKMRGKGRRNQIDETIELQGVHFHRSGLPLLGIADSAGAALLSEKAKPGRRPTYDWGRAIANVWGQIYRGDMKPDTQADIERALQATLSEGDHEPTESTVRPYAKHIWEEFQRD